jgi:hypothetical protein
MQGNAQLRHCEHCNKDVHNLAAMSPKAIEELITQTGGKFCARIVRCEDGSLLTRDTSAVQPRPLFPARVLTTASMMISAASVFAQIPKEQPQVIQAAQSSVTSSAKDSNVPVAGTDQSSQQIPTTTANIGVVTVAEDSRLQLSENALTEFIDPAGSPSQAKITIPVKGQSLPANSARRPWHFVKRLFHRKSSSRAS